jgi:TonB family protein
MKPRKVPIFAFPCFLILFTSAIAQQQNSPAYATGTGAAQAKQGSPDVYVVGNGVKPPVPLQQPLPVYTPEARAARIEGIVVVQAVIRKDGTVDSFKVLRGLGYGLDESAINTMATKWRFSPGTLNGEPVDVIASIEVAFRLFMDPAELESLKPYDLHVQIVTSQWNGVPSPSIEGSGYGNVWKGDSGSGFIYQCSCAQPFGQHGYSGRWIEPESSLELALGYDKGAGKQKTCELKVQIQKSTYTLRDGQVVPMEPPLR